MLHSVVGLVLLLAVSQQQTGTVSRVGAEGIGPKQDDPLAMCDPSATPSGTPGGQNGIIVQGGREGIGPKQDDPRRLRALSRPGDDNDPKASGGQSGIIVQGGREAIGPKQDDPRKLGALSRPGDDNDPKAICNPAGR
jgi:hypothetical protein